MVCDGHGGGTDAAHASQILMSHVTANVPRALQTQMIPKGEFSAYREHQDADVLDFDSVLRGQHDKTSSFIDDCMSKRDNRRRADKSSGSASKEDAAKIVRAASADHGASHQSPDFFFLKTKNVI